MTKTIDFFQTKKILIVRLSSIGDIVQALPVASLLRTNFPGAQIDWISEEPSYNLLLTNEYLDNVLVFPRYNWQNLLKKREFKAFKKEFKLFSQRLQREKYDLVLDLHNIFRSGLVTGLTKAPRRWGYGTREGNILFLTKKFLPPSSQLHVTDQYLRTLKEVGLPKSNVDYGFKAMAEPDFIKNKQPFVLIHPFSRWQTKNWPIENYVLLGKELAKRNLTVFFTGSQDDAAAIEKALKREKTLFSLAGRTSLEEFIALTQRATVFIGGDTGPMHIAAANCPVVAIMGPTASSRYGPYGQKNSVVTAKLDCLGCHKRYCSHSRCMKMVTPDMVLELLEEKLEKGGRRDGAARRQ